MLTKRLLTSILVTLFIGGVSLFSVFKREAVAPFAKNPEWLIAYRQLHVDMLEGRRDLHARVFQIAFGGGGLGDRIRGMLHVFFACVASGQAFLLDWRAVGGPDNLDIAQRIFLPHAIWWNRTVEDDNSAVAAVAAGVPQDNELPNTSLERQRLGLDVYVPPLLQPWVSDPLPVIPVHVAPHIGDVLRNRTTLEREWPLSSCAYKANLSNDDCRKEIVSQTSPVRRTVWSMRTETSQLLKTLRMVKDNSNADELSRTMNRWPQVLGYLFKLAPDVQTLLADSAMRIFNWWNSKGYEMNRGDIRKANLVDDGLFGLPVSRSMQMHSNTTLPRFIGMHFRYGDMAFGAKRSIRVKASFLNDFLNCAEKFAWSLGWSDVVFVFFSDNQDTRNQIRDGKITLSSGKPIYTPQFQSGETHHVEHQDPTGERTVETVAEVMLLSSMDALLLTPSGFGKVALWFSQLPKERVASFDQRCFIGWRYLT